MPGLPRQRGDTLHIREADMADAAAINHLAGDMGYKTVTPEIAEQRLRDILESTGDELWVAEEGDQVKGWLHAFVARRAGSSSFAEIGGLVVSASCRRQGIGRRLVDHAKQWARGQGLRLRVRCNTKRIETHAFYNALDFTAAKTQLVFDTD